MCDAHHIRHWADGGPTCLDYLVMLFGHHHRTLHDTTWHVRLRRDTGHGSTLRRGAVTGRSGQAPLPVTVTGTLPRVALE